MSWLKLLAPQKLLIAVVEWRIFAAAFFGLPMGSKPMLLNLKLS